MINTNEWKADEILGMNEDAIWEICRDKPHSERMEEARAVWEDYMTHQMAYKKPTILEYIALVRKSLVIIGSVPPTIAEKDTEYTYRYNVIAGYTSNRTPCECALSLLQAA